MFLLLSIVTLLIAPSLGATGSLSRLKSLRFADNSNSYVRFSPDWSPLMNAVSVCGWIRDIGSSSYHTFFQYHDGSTEVTILADGQYIGIFGSYQQLQSKFSVPKGTWHHVCITWSASSRAHRYYVNGQALGSQQTPSGRSLRTGGALTLGNWGTSGSNHNFGGEMAYLNVYAKELSASEVARMVQQGMCTNIAAVDEHESSRVIKWEEIVKLGRSGTVTDAYVVECVDSIIEETGAKLEESERKRNETAEELKETLAEKDKMEEELSTKLNATLAELDETKSEKDKMEEELSTKLNATLAELEEISTNLNRTWDWEIFLSEQFLNKTFTSEHSELLHSSWDDIAERLVGIRITDEFLKLLDHVDPVEDRPWSMLYSENYFNEVFTREMADRLTNIWDGISNKLVGVTMTKEVIELLNHVTDKTNCGN